MQYPVDPHLTAGWSNDRPETADQMILYLSLNFIPLFWGESISRPAGELQIPWD